MQSYNTEAALGHGVLGSERHLGGIWDWCSGHEEEEKEKGTYGGRWREEMDLDSRWRAPIILKFCYFYP
jgi:hypothetical protein